MLDGTVEKRKVAAIVAMVVAAIATGVIVGKFNLDMFIGGVFVVTASAVLLAWGFPEWANPENWVDWRN